MTDQEDQIVFDILPKEDINLFTSFFNRIRKRSLPNSFFYRKYDCQNKYDDSFNGIMRQGDQIMGHLGVLHEAFKVSNSTLKGGQISDAALDRGLRGKGYFQKIILNVIRVAREKQYDFLWVAPSPQAVNGFLSTNWVKFDQIVHFQKEVKPRIPLYRISHKLRLGSIYDTFISIKLNRFKIESFITTQNKLTIIKDKEFLKRKNYTKNYTIKIGEISLWIKFNDGMVIGHMEGNINNPEELIKKLSSFAQSLGCHKISIICTKKSDTFQLLKNELDYKLSLNLYGIIMNNSIKIEDLSIDGADLNTF